MEPTSHEQLLLATRIHHALMRYLGSGIDVGRMVQSEDYAREVLFVCEGCGDVELKSLGEQFKRVRGPFEPLRDEPLPAFDDEPPDSGFDLPAAEPAAPPVPRWKRWLRRLRARA
ncbi:MAG TPA: hypothetical protein VLU41_12840 [Ideonella sp.]|nr:hypothetical protein [Ideonella sp.]